MRSLALLVNPDSGSGRAEEVEELLRGAGARVESFPVDEPERAAASGAERLAVAGGDGSIGFAAATASAAGLPLAVIPTGTANDFAAMLGLPAEIGSACELAARGEARRALELGSAGSRPFVNIASAGLSPRAAEHAHGLKGRLGVLAYPAGALKAGFGAHPVTCELRCDGSTIHSGEAWQVSIACTGAFGGGASVDADASDGRLHVVVIEGSGRARLVKHAFGMRIGRVESQEGVTDRRCSTAELILDPGEGLNVDGELILAEDLGGGGRIDFAVEPNAFELIVG